MSASALVAQLAAAGTPPELLAAVAQELFLAEAERAALAGRRKNERERKAKSRDVTGQDVTRCDIPAPLVPPKVSPTPPSNNPPISPTPANSDELVPPSIKPEQVVEAWNVMADGCGVHKCKLTPERRKKLKPFINRHTIDDITEAIWAVPRSPFLTGENDRGWKAGIDFLLQPSSFTKLLEGTYG